MRTRTRPDAGRTVARDAAPGDADAIAAIYNEGIEDRIATLVEQLLGS